MQSVTTTVSPPSITLILESFLMWQLLHSLIDGKYLSTLYKGDSYHSDLYGNCLTNSDYT
ncbi:hypothetical protein CV680_05340 [Borreliella burgdorferi]|nr:hypothetical protein CV680_05340 [Borreliella burgdorferi]